MRILVLFFFPPHDFSLLRRIFDDDDLPRIFFFTRIHASYRLFRVRYFLVEGERQQRNSSWTLAVTGRSMIFRAFRTWNLAKRGACGGVAFSRLSFIYICMGFFFSRLGGSVGRIIWR